MQDGVWFNVALSPQGNVLGFNCIYRENLNVDRLYGLYLIVEQGSRLHGLGSLLYDNLLDQATGLGAGMLKVRVRDTCDEGLRFATQRGFGVKKYSIEMIFDLKTWDASRYEPILQYLQSQGFRFTNMAEIGDTQEAPEALYPE